MLYGAGRLAFCSNALDSGSIIGHNVLLPQCLASFSLNAETEEAVARCLINGVRQTTASAVAAEDYLLEVTYENIDFNTLGLLYGEIPTTETNVVFPVLKEAFVDGGGQIVDAELIAGVLPTVKAYDNTNDLFLEPVAGAPGVNQVQTDTAGSLTFEATNQPTGTSISYIFDKTYPSLNTIFGADNVDSLNNLRFSGVISSAIDGIDGIGIVVDRLDRTTVPSFTVEGTTVSITMTYRLSTVPGQRRPFRLFQISDAI